MDVHNRNLRDAILYSISANSQHGLQRKPQDKRKAVLQLLNDSEWSQWSEREIARQCSVSPYLVSQLKLSVTDCSVSEKLYINKHGKRSRMRIVKSRRRSSSVTSCPDCERLKERIAELEQEKEEKMKEKREERKQKRRKRMYYSQHCRQRVS